MSIKEIKNKFINEILKNNNNSILILKGFEFDENVAIPKLIDDDILSISKKAKIKEYLLKSLTLTKNEKNYAIDFSQFIIIENNKLTGVLETLNRDLVLIDFDLFGEDYLTIIDNNKKNIIKEFESDIDNEVSKTFSIMEETKNYLIYSYTEIELNKMKIFKFSDFLREKNLKVKTNDSMIVDFANINKFDLLGKMFLAANSLSSIKIVNNKTEE
jgi:hypothetical protein